MSDIPFEFDLSCSADNQFNITAAIIASGVNFSNYVTHSELTSALGNISTGTTLYASSLINDVPFLTSHQSLANYYTKTETNAAIAAAAPVVTQTVTTGVEIGSVGGTKLYAPSQTAVDLSNYYTKTESDSAFLKESDVLTSLNSGTAIATIGSKTIYAPAGGGSSGTAVCVFG